MCKTITEGRICNGTNYFTCECPTLQYYDNIEGKCQPQMLNDSTCSQLDACRSDLGLSCQDDTCQCDSTIQFWNVTKCDNYLTYKKGICTSNSECNFDTTVLICRTSGV